MSHPVQVFISARVDTFGDIPGARDAEGVVAIGVDSVSVEEALPPDGSGFTTNFSMVDTDLAAAEKAAAEGAVPLCFVKEAAAGKAAAGDTDLTPAEKVAAEVGVAGIGSLVFVIQNCSHSENS